jgi:hypothetical protein
VSKPKTFKEMFDEALPYVHRVVEPFIPKLMDALKAANTIRCPKCHRPQPEGTERVIYKLDGNPDIKCECGYEGEGVTPAPWTQGAKDTWDGSDP